MIRVMAHGPADEPPKERSRWHPLLREISFVLLFKLIAITALFLLFFRHSERPDVGPPEVSQTIYGVDGPLNISGSE